MADKTSIPGLSPDSPIECPESDCLGYKPFAKRIADSFIHMAPKEGFVLAVHGTWGQGKSGVLNLIRHYVKEKDADNATRIVDFNPWWFGNRTELVKNLLARIQEQLPSEGDAGKKMVTAFAKLAWFCSKLPTPAKDMFDAAKECLTEQDPAVPEMKKLVSEAIKAAGLRLLVVVDDIDRLEAEEIRDLFRAIKAVADFPNVFYLLAFDRSMVVDALNHVQPVSGERYLEKIVQASFELPAPDPGGYMAFCEDSLTDVLSNAGMRKYDKGRFGEYLKIAVGGLLTTPRHVVRLCNALHVTCASSTRVDPVDLVALETIRLLTPNLWLTVRDNPEMFAGPMADKKEDASPSGRTPPLRSTVKKANDEWMQALKNDTEHTKVVDGIARLVKLIFPKVRAAYEVKGAGYQHNPEGDFRAMSPEYLHRYFLLTLSGDM